MKNLCLVAVWLVASALVVQAQVPPVAIGVLTDMIGPSKDMAGPGAVTAVQMAVEDFGGSVLNRPVTVFSGDHQLKPDVGAGIARRWYDDGVDLIVDVPVSAVGLAVQAVSKEMRRLFITSGTLTSDFTSKFCTPFSMQWAFNTTAIANATALAAVQRGLKRWFFLTADYAIQFRPLSRCVDHRGAAAFAVNRQSTAARQAGRKRLWRGRQNSGTTRVPRLRVRSNPAPRLSACRASEGGAANEPVARWLVSERGFTAAHRAEGREAHGKHDY